MKTLFVAFLALACSPMGKTGPSFTLGEGFDEYHRLIVEQSIQEYDEALGLRMQLRDKCEQSEQCVPIEREDDLKAVALGFTNLDRDFPERSYILVTLAGATNEGDDVASFSFHAVITHELGHVLGLTHGGADGHGHSANVEDVMFATAPFEDVTLTENDIRRISEAFERSPWNQ